jgi:hypothetical protein
MASSVPASLVRFTLVSLQPRPGRDTMSRISLLVISVGGAIVVGTGLLYTARNYRLSRRGQVTDRFTVALERLGSGELYVRIGGVHALEHVMRDSAEHHNDVIEVLTEFIRDRAPRRARQSDRQVWMHPVTGSTPDLPSEPTPDVQAALTALGHRRPRPLRQTINLHGLHLAVARLRDANLTGVDLAAADLARADLMRADLIRARLESVNLTGALLIGANLTRANLTVADLTGGRLHGTRFHGADLTGALLHGDSRTRLERFRRVPEVAVPEGWERNTDGRLKRSSTSWDGQGHGT